MSVSTKTPRRPGEKRFGEEVFDYDRAAFVARRDEKPHLTIDYSKRNNLNHTGFITFEALPGGVTEYEGSYQLDEKPKITIKARKAGSATVLDCAGKLTQMIEADTFRHAVTQELAKGHKKLVASLAGVPYTDDGGFQELYAAFDSAAKAGGELKLAAPNEPLKEALKLSKGSKFRVYDTVDEAVSSPFTSARSDKSKPRSYGSNNFSDIAR